MKDTFKKEYSVLPDIYKQRIYHMKQMADELEKHFDAIANREMSLARTNLEQAIMWATKAYVIDADEKGISTPQ